MLVVVHTCLPACHLENIPHDFDQLENKLSYKNYIFSQEFLYYILKIAELLDKYIFIKTATILSKSLKL